MDQVIHVLPGMGADERMFPGPWRELPGVSFVRWPSGRELEDSSIEALAARVIRNQEIRDGDVVIGSSLGGMVACEICKLRKVDQLFLVGSAVNPAEIHSLLQMLHPLAGVVPMAMIQLFAGKIPSDLSRMFHDADPAFVTAMCRALFQWEGLDASRNSPIRIHGRNDSVIPLPSGVDLVLNAGHLVAMTHAKECVAFIRSRLEGHQA